MRVGGGGGENYRLKGERRGGVGGEVIGRRGKSERSAVTADREQSQAITAADTANVKR